MAELPRSGDGPVTESPGHSEIEFIVSADPTPVYNVAAVAHRTGLRPATLRVWEQRYRLPSPNRLGRRRLYSERDVREIEWICRRRAEGMTVSAAISLLRISLGQRESRLDVPRAPSDFVSPLEQAILQFDEADVLRILDRAFALYSTEQVCIDVIQPVLFAIGDGWQTGRVNVAQEHFASAVFRRQLDRLRQLITFGPASRTVVATTPPGEWHEIGLLMASLFLARRNWRVVYLGPSVPPTDLRRAVEVIHPTALIFSATLPDPARGLADLIPFITGADRGHPPLVGVGGQAFDRDPLLRTQIPALYLGPTALVGVERLEEVISIPAAEREEN